MADTSEPTDLFRDYVTGTSFSLTLSRRMIDMLSHMDQLGYSFGDIRTARGLHDRGLVEWADRERANELFASGVPADHRQVNFYKFRLTEAGKALIPLLKLSGLYRDLGHLESVELPEPEVRLKEPDHG